MLNLFKCWRAIMTKVKSYLLLPGILGLLIFAGCSSMKSTDILNFIIPANGYIKQQFNYGKHDRQSLDVYLPKTENKKTPIVFIYGGAWREGSKKDYEFVGHALSGLGHPVIIPDYRLYPEVKFPDFMNDIADAVAFIEDNSDKILGKPFNQYIMMGHSAGAHSAALFATDKQYQLKRDIGAQLTGLIVMAGPYDLPLDDPEVTTVFEGYSDKQVNPILKIHTDMPPVLLLHGLNDDRVLPYHTENFSTALQQKGITVTKHLYPGVNHTQLIGSLATPLRFLNNSYDDIKKFLATLN